MSGCPCCPHWLQGRLPAAGCRLRLRMQSASCSRPSMADRAGATEGDRAAAGPTRARQPSRCGCQGNMVGRHPTGSRVPGRPESSCASCIFGRWASNTGPVPERRLRDSISDPCLIAVTRGQTHLLGRPAKKDYAPAAVTEKQRNLITFAGRGEPAPGFDHAVCSGRPSVPGRLPLSCLRRSLGLIRSSLVCLRPTAVPGPGRETGLPSAAGSSARGASTCASVSERRASFLQLPAVPLQRRQHLQPQAHADPRSRCSAPAPAPLSAAETCQPAPPATDRAAGSPPSLSRLLPAPS